MSDEKLVEKELFTNTYINGRDYGVGDVVELTEGQATRLEEQGLVGDVGTFKKLRKEHDDNQQAERDREAERVEERDELARTRGELSQSDARMRSHLADSGPSAAGDDTSRVARDNAPDTPDPTSGGDSSPRVNRASSAQDGPKVTRGDNARSQRR